MSKALEFLKMIFPDSIVNAIDKEDADLEALKTQANQTIKEIFLNGMKKDDVPESIVSEIQSEAKRQNLGKSLTIVEKILLKKIGVNSNQVAQELGVEAKDLKIEQVAEFFVKKVEEQKDVSTDEWKSKFEAEQQKVIDLNTQFESKLAEKDSLIEASKNEFESFKQSQIVDKVRTTRFNKFKSDNVFADWVDRDIYELKKSQYLKSKGYVEKLDENGNLTYETKDGTKITNGKEFLSTDKIELDFIQNSTLYKKGDGGNGGQNPNSSPEVDARLQKAMEQANFGE